MRDECIQYSWLVFDETNLSCYSKYKLWDNCFIYCVYSIVEHILEMLDISSCCPILYLRGREGINREVIMMLYSLSQGWYHVKKLIGLCGPRSDLSLVHNKESRSPGQHLGPSSVRVNHIQDLKHKTFGKYPPPCQRGHSTRHKYLNFLILKRKFQNSIQSC